MSLTSDQVNRLRRLDDEIKRKEAFKERLTQESVETGIPVDILHLDVIRYGKFFGLIRNRDDVAQRSNNNNDTKSTTTFERIPHYYRPSTQSTVSNSDKTRIVDKLIEKSYQHLRAYVRREIDDEILVIDREIGVDLYVPPRYRDNIAYFVKYIEDMIQLILLDDDNDKRHHISSEIKRCLVGFDANVVPPRGTDTKRLLRYLIVKHYGKTKPLRPFDVDALIDDIQTTLDVTGNAVDVKYVIFYSLLSPFMSFNNNVVVCDNKFYILKEIRDNVHMWLQDTNLDALCRLLRLNFGVVDIGPFIRNAVYKHAQLIPTDVDLFDS